MNAHDLREFQGLLEKRQSLLSFINGKLAARCLGIYISAPYPTRWDGPPEAGYTVHIEDKTTIDAIMALALPAARKHITDIEERLTKAGVEFSNND